MRNEAGCASELDYSEQTNWILFLKYLGDREAERADEAALEGRDYSPILYDDHRWREWAMPKDADGELDHHKARNGDRLTKFVNEDLFPYLAGF